MLRPLARSLSLCELVSLSLSLSLDLSLSISVSHSLSLSRSLALSISLSLARARVDLFRGFSTTKGGSHVAIDQYKRVAMLLPVYVEVTRRHDEESVFEVTRLRQESQDTS